MANPTDLAPQIGTSAQNPSEAAQDGLSAKAHPLPDAIEADRYLAGKANQANGPPFGVRFAAIVSPGAQQGCNRPWGGCGR